MFDQLGLTANEQRIAIEALVSIASRTRIECLTTKVTDDKALLQEENEITFSDEDMEVGYSDHRRPLYLVAFINQTPPQESLGGYGCFHIPHPTKYLTGFGGRCVYRRPYSVVVESEINSLFGQLPRGKNEGLIPRAIGKTVVA